MAVRLAVSRNNLFSQFLLPQNIVIKRSFNFGTGLKFRINQSNLSSKCKKGENISYRIATIHDQNAVIELLRKHFYPDEPITRESIERMKPQDNAHEEYAVSLLNYGTSVVAMDSTKSNKIIGVSLSGEYTPFTTEWKFKEAERTKNTNQIWSNVMTLMARLEKKANILERYDAKKTLDVSYTAVEKEYRGDGIAAKMLQKMDEEARLLGHTHVTTICTGHYSIQVALTMLQMEYLAEIMYADYKDSDGKQVFNPPPPHTRIGIYGKALK